MVLNLKKERITLIFLAIAILIGIRAFATPGFYTSHDGETHTARIANYYQAITEGQLPPKLAPTLFQRLGFPIFIFIYPIPYLVGSAFHYIGFSYTDSAELTMAVGHLLSGLFFYLFLKSETKKTLPSIIGTLFFTWAPYRFSMLFVRGAFAESFAYLFVSLSLLCLHFLFKTRSSKWLAFTSLSLTGLLLSHQLASIMFLPVITWYAIFKLFSQKNKKQALLQFVSSIILAFTMAAYLYLPAFFERSFLRFDELISYTSEHFVTIRQLIRSPWSYGFSHQGFINDDMSFQVGLTHISAAALAAVSTVLGLIFSRKKFKIDSSRYWLLVWLVPLSLSILLMLHHPINFYLWKTLPGLTYLDFPWRLLGVTTITSSFIATYLAIRYKNNLLLVTFLLFFVFYANRNHLRINKTVEFSDQHFETYTKTATWKNEFLTKWRVSNKTQGIEGDYTILEGDAQINVIEDKTHQLTLDVQVDKKARLLINRLYFPGWQLTINDQQLEPFSESFQISSYTDLVNEIDYSGLLMTDLEPGEYTIKARFASTKLRTIANSLTWLGIIINLTLLASPKFINKHFFHEK